MPNIGIYLWKGYGTRTSKTMLPNVSPANTQIQLWSGLPNMCYIFEKIMVWGPQKQSSHLSDMEIHTKTLLHKNCFGKSYRYAIFSKMQRYEDLKNSVLSCLTCKYKYTKNKYAYTHTRIQIRFQIGQPRTLKTLFPSVWSSNTQIFEVQDSHSSTGSSFKIGSIRLDGMS